MQQKKITKSALWSSWSFRGGLVLLAALAAAPSLQFGPFPAAPVDTDRDQVNQLIAIHRSIPLTLNSDVFYNRKIRELMDMQRRVRHMIDEMPAQHELEAVRPRPIHMTLTAKPEEAEGVIAMIVNPASIRSWRSRLAEYVYDKLRNSSQDTVGAIQKRLFEFIRGNRNPSPRELETQVAVALYLHRYLEGRSLKADGYGFRESLRNLEEGDLNYLEETVLYQEILKEAAAGAAAGTAEKLVAGLHRTTDYFKKELIPATSKFIGSVSVEDVGPDVGIFRGFFGNDCSTMLSAPYPYSPSERTFFLFDGDRNRLGYGAGTHVLFNGRPAFYFHTINGPWINAAQVQQVIDGLYRSREQLGVEAIVLSDESRARSNINFTPISDTFVSNIRRSSARPGYIQHLDSPVRAVFHANSRGDYDLEKTNSHGFEYIPDHDPTAIADIKVEFTAHDVVTPMKAGEIAPLADVLALAHGLSKVANRKEDARWVLEAYGYSEKEWDAYRDLLANKEALSPGEHAAKVRSTLTGWGMTDEQFKLHQAYFSEIPEQIFVAAVKPSASSSRSSSSSFPWAAGDCDDDLHDKWFY